MAGFGVLKVASLMLILCMVVAAPRAKAAISCGSVAGKLGPCIPYLQGKAGAVPPPCCSGVKSLNGAAQTTPDRQAACKCLKNIAGGIPGINFGLASGLPGKCGVSIPYKISPSTDCNSVK